MMDASKGTPIAPACGGRATMILMVRPANNASLKLERESQSIRRAQARVESPARQKIAQPLHGQVIPGDQLLEI